MNKSLLTAEEDWVRDYFSQLDTEIHVAGCQEVCLMLLQGLHQEIPQPKLCCDSVILLFLPCKWLNERRQK